MAESEECETLLSFGFLWIVISKHLYLDDQLVVVAGCRFSLEGNLLTIMSRIRPLFIRLLLKIRKHQDELVLRSIVPCPHGAVGVEDILPRHLQYGR